MRKPTTMDLQQHIDGVTVKLSVNELGSSALNVWYDDESAEITILDPEPKAILELVQNLLSFHRVLLANEAR